MTYTFTQEQRLDNALSILKSLEGKDAVGFLKSDRGEVLILKEEGPPVGPVKFSWKLKAKGTQMMQRQHGKKRTRGHAIFCDELYGPGQIFAQVVAMNHGVLIRDYFFFVDEPPLNCD